MVETPVLFITFVRPEYARKTWDGIKAAKPKTLYFYSNKGRADKVGEIERNDEIRSYISEIDWECNLQTWFRDETVNVYDSLKGAISWLFDNEEYGIVLEEDCEPTLAFFSYCEQLLKRYEKDKRIWIISGDNFLSYNPGGYDIIYSHHFQIYGWASWRDRWLSINWDNLDIDNFIKSKNLNRLYSRRCMVNQRINNLRKNKDFFEKTQCWDGIFQLTMEQNNALCIYPKELLVTNNGILGTHNKNAKRALYNTIATNSDKDYLIESYPPFMFADYVYDHYMYKHFLKGPTFIKKIYNTLSYRIPLIIKKCFK